jgi:hypothetical protein
MRKVFQNSEICHIYANQTQTEGRTPNSNLFFYNKKLYSYGHHFLLCEFLDKNTVLINDTFYSSTTARHKNLVVNSTTHLKQYFKSETNSNEVLNFLETNILKYSRSRKYKNFYFNMIENILNNYFNFLEYKKLLTSSKKIKEHRKILKFRKSWINNKTQFETEILKADKKNKIREKIKNDKKLKNWKNHETQYLHTNSNNAYLRVSKNKKNIETSKGIKIDILEAKRVLKLIDQKNAVGNKIQNYTILQSDKFFRAGCHTISNKEIQTIRKKLKI